MSDIAKKTLPPGSWPGAKGGSKTDKTAESAQSDAAAPRSAATAEIPKEGSEAQSEDMSPSHYTHQKENPLEDIQEEDQPIKMTEEKSQKEGDDMKEVEPKAEADDESQAATEDRTTNTEGQDASSKTSLTEQAKKAFDQASENQPTDQARNDFLETARSGAGVTEGSGKEKSEVEASQQSGEEAQDELASSEIQEKTATELKEGQQADAPTVSGEETEKGEEGAPTATEGDVEVEENAPTEAQETAPTEAQEKIGSEAGSQPQAETETAPGDLDSKAAEGIDAQDTVPETAETAPQTAETAPEDGQTLPEDGQTMPEDGQTVPEDTQPEDGQAMPEGAQTMTESATVPEQLDFSVLKNAKVNKGGNVVNGDGKVVGRVVEGILQYLVGKKVDENGDIWSDNGKVIGKAEPISDSERDDMMKESAPFESFEDAVVDGNGMVVSNGEWVGKVVEGDIKQLRGKSVDPDGDILDKGGNVIGRAERWEPEPEEEPEPEAEVNRSILAGKRVNKAGNVVDGSGTIFGRVVEGDPKRMVGRMCNKNGEILSESGDVIGRAEVVPEGEREGVKEGPFAELQGCTVAKDGTVVTPSGDVVGRLVSGDAKVLFGRAVDEDGDVLDRNGNSIGKAERWEPEKVEHKKNPMCGRRVNREGNVVDEDGNVIGKLTSGDPTACSGKEIDNDGDVVDQKGTVIGHCSLLEDIPKEEEAVESPEDKEKREKAETDRKLAIQMSVCIEQCLDKIRPICKMITEKIDQAERTPEDERDEEALVREVRPLIEEGGRILTEAKGVIKGLDPDGRISANAKHKTAAREATPEEYHLADVLKDLTGDVTQCIENAKKKLEGMPHAKKELNPLWGLLNEPLFQILAAVGLLLSGVLGLVGRLLSGLGLGGLLDGLLGTLGINRVLEGLGVGSITGDKKGKSGGGGGGLLGGLLGGGK